MLIKKGRLGKLSHNDVCRFCFELYIDKPRLDEKIEWFILDLINDDWRDSLGYEEWHLKTEIYESS